ncbi:MAG: tetratricopeptide repeat protein [Nitrospira sp.]|nr:tetratricopeptide repeat protein [Nitrospira sp.]
MPPDRSRVLQQAQLLASRGQFEAAIAEWKKLAMEMPGDGSIHNSIGDLHLKRNVPGEAATAFLQAASAFRAEGATLKAIAAFKKVLKCDPTRYEVYRHLGDLNVERGLISSAVQDYLTLGKYYLKERRGKDALEIYKKIVTQDPSNLNAQQRVAELCVQENQQDEATTVYLQLGREKSAQGRYDEAKDAYLAVLRIDPANSEAAQFVDSLEKGGTGAVKAIKPSSPPGGGQKPPEPPDLLTEAMRRIEQKQYEGAEAILNQILTREPGNPEVCQLLARLHLQRGDVQVALGEYRFLAGAALRAHDLGLAESLIEEFLSAEPNSVPLLELKGELFEEKGDHGGAALQYAKAVELLLEHPEPGMESLHEELFEKVKALSNDETFVNQLAAKIHGGATGEPSESLQTASVHDTMTNGDSALDGSTESAEHAVQPACPSGLHEVTEEVQGFSLVGAEPDDVNPFAKDPGVSERSQGDSGTRNSSDTS